MSTRYSGYRPYATLSLLTAPPGHSDTALHGKYQHSSSAEVPDAQKLGLTESGRMSALSANAVAEAHTLRMSQRATSAASSARLGAGGSAANTVSRSMYGAEYPNYFAEGKQLRSITEPELRSAFELVADSSDAASIASSRKLLACALHQEPSRRQLDVFESALARVASVSSLRMRAHRLMCYARLHACPFRPP
jgi:hypothetical protein